MAPAHPESSRKGALVAAVVGLLILCFLPGSVLSWMSGPRHLISMLLTPVSDPLRSLATWIAPPAPRPDDAKVAHLEAERERWKTLYWQNDLRIAELLKRIEELQKGAAGAEVPIQQLNTRATAGSTSPTGGSLQIGVGTNRKVTKGTIAATGGDQLVGRVVDVGSRQSIVALITDKASGPIDGLVLKDDGTTGADIRNMMPMRGQSVLQGQVKYPGDNPKEGDVVRLQDQGWPRSAQRLIVGKVTKISQLAGGRAVVEVTPTVSLSRLTEIVLRIPQAEQEGGGK